MLSRSGHGTSPAARGAAVAAAFVFLVLATTAGAQAPALTPHAPECLPKIAHGVVSLSVADGTPEDSIRVYFRQAAADEDAPFYYLEMKRGRDGDYWAVLPKPLCTTEEVDLYFSAGADPATAVRTEVQTVGVGTSCAECLPVLTPAQLDYAQNIVLGETVADQAGMRPDGFCCDGVVSRVDADGTLGADANCGQERLEQVRCSCVCPLAVADRKILPLLVLGGSGGVIAVIREDDKREASPSRP